MNAKPVAIRKPQDLAAVVAQADNLLRIWEVDIDTAETSELKHLCGTAAAALLHHQPAALAERLRAIATAEDIVLAVDEVMAAFPSIREKADVRVWTRMLAEELTKDKPPLAALRAGVRAVIRVADMPPSIAAVLAAVASQKTGCESKAALLDRLPRRVAEVATRLGAI